MTTKQFKQECKKLEKNGWTLVEYEPNNKYAKYVRNLSTFKIGKQK